MEKLRFEFELLPSSDKKSNTVYITSIATSDEKVYIIPEEVRYVGCHTELIKTPAYTKVRNSLKKRHQTRKIWITMTKEIRETYLDEDGNLQFDNQYLEEVDQKQTIAQINEASALERIYEKMVENVQETKEQNLKHIADKFVVEKFTSKNSNANQWIDIFEK